MLERPAGLANESAICLRRNPDRTPLRLSLRCGTPSAIDVAHYIDTSALVKLVVAEPETEALQAWLSGGERDPIASDLARTELFRAIRRVAPDLLVAARTVLDSVTLLTVPTRTFEEAGRLEPPSLRSLDAIHVAAALELGDDLEGLVTYDERLARAAEGSGISIVAPK